MRGQSRVVDALDGHRRMPRAWKVVVAEAYAGMLRVDSKTGRMVLVDPGTDEPLVDHKGEILYDPTLTDLALLTLHRALQDPDIYAEVFSVWMRSEDRAQGGKA